LSLIVFEALLIGGLILQRRSRRKAERELEITYDRLRLAVNSSKSAGWDWDIKSEQNRWFGDLETIFGISSHTYLAEVGELQRRAHPADRAIVSKAIADARREHKPYAAEFRVIREPDQSMRWIATRGQFYYASNGDAIRMLGMAVDITEQKQMEEQVRDSEERFRLVANTAPVMIWMSGSDKLCTYLNPPWLNFRGRTLENELGRGWLEGVHPDDLKHCVDTYSQAFDEGKSFNMQYRVRRHDCAYRWLLDVGVPRFNSDG
jgi:PAS domain S-box-containing protein